jgi:hypothetical protein
MFLNVFNNQSMFLYALLIFSNSLKKINVGRNMSGLRKVVSGKYNFNISTLFVNCALFVNS